MLGRREKQWCFSASVDTTTTTTAAEAEPSSRRSTLITLFHATLSIAAAAASLGVTNLTPKPALAAPSIDASSNNKEDLIQSINSARETLQILLDNWEKAVIDCTYADVPRELLEQRNKEILLEKASTFALFDKSVSVVSCKTTNRVVRDYLGATGIGPLVGLEKRLRQGLEWVEEDADDKYVACIENIQQNLAKAQSLSYAAGVADFSSVNNFAEAEKQLVLVSPNSNLEQTRQSIVMVVEDLKQVLALISGRRR